MRIEFDPVKNEWNIQERDLSFERAVEFYFDTADYLADDRQDYGERRIIAVGYLDRRLHVMCFVEIEDGIRVISFRKANFREATKHGKTLTPNQ
ncbi:MAG: BrnT family toxin [Thiobacillus sp.]